MFDEHERIGQEVVEVYFKVLSWHSPEGTEGNHKNFGQGHGSPD